MTFKTEAFIKEEMDLFKNLCISIASKNLDITPYEMTKYVSEVCNVFRVNYREKYISEEN